MNQGAPRYSLIIATYNRLEELQELLQTVEKLDFPRDQFELIVSDDGSSDGTGDFLANHPYSFQLRYLYQENKGPGEARNHGMREAKGTYYLFIDSDCLLPTDYLATVDAHLQREPLDAFGGPDDCHPSFGPLLKAINYSMTSFIGTGGTRGARKSVAKFYPRSFNMGIHQKVFSQIGGMNKLRHGQDMDFSARIYDAGFRVGLIPDAVVYHKRRTSIRRFYKQIFNWGVARINLGRTYPGLLKPIHLAPAILVAGVVIALILALVVSWGWYFLAAAGVGALGVALLAFVQSTARYGQVGVGFLSIITLFIQVFAYGMGTWSGLWQWATGKREARGFTKNYYK